MHLHFDLVGGISGDMFIGAMLDCFPEHADSLTEQINLAGFEEMVSLRHEPFSDGILSGHKFDVEPTIKAESHHHRHYHEIESILKRSDLDEKTRAVALEIFKIIAIAEAKIHNTSIESVSFHEVGAWDSIADVVCAAYLIAQSDIRSTSVSSLPLGGGQVKTAHGTLPVPAPATALILEDFKFTDDGITGERITPTGAAILKYLNPKKASPGRLIRQGFGFGTRKFPGISNVLRILHFESDKSELWKTQSVSQIEFELDDQTAEEIANALDQLRKQKGVLDVIQYSVLGKKNRLSTSIRLLYQASNSEEIQQACFRLTTTLGLRLSEVTRSILSRTEKSIQRDGKSYRVKVTDRPGGVTAKGEMDDFSGDSNIAKQRQARNEIESASIKENKDK